MTSSITEWEFVARVKSWIDAAIRDDQRRLSLFSEAECEQRGRGSQKRRDLSLLDKDKRVVLTGEVRLPYRPDGSSPYNERLVQDARRKAQRARCAYFFTWNVNECVLWETFSPSEPGGQRKYKTWRVANVAKESDLQNPSILNDLKRWLPVFLLDFADVVQGTVELGIKSPDERFIETLESSLEMPIILTIEELDKRYKQALFRKELDEWMRDDQGWVISDDADDIRENLERAAKFACYALVNKLVFYEALRKRYPTDLDKIAIPKHVDTGEKLRLRLWECFAGAVKETRDYETVFGGDPSDIGNCTPFYSDVAASHWRTLIEQIHVFDFSKLDYDVIGNIFELLIAPEERHKYGQYYTRPEVVDLINSFAIRTGDEKVMDPACGGGTFLVRAYVRKKELGHWRKHGEILKDLFGVDISHFATHLTTINLATRDLIDEDNYPQVARSDFFEVRRKRTFLALPAHPHGVKVKTGGLGKTQKREVTIPPLDAVVGNPPYVRQEDIAKSPPGKTKRGTKEYYSQVVKEDFNNGVELSGRSDLHCYFWPHAASFLKQDGYLCLLTSSQWLDVEYGFRLQEWILRNFRIVAVFESVDEPWFVGARVATAVTILQREDNHQKRMNNVARFVQLRRPIKEVLASNGTSAGQMRAVDAFREEILGLKANSVNERYRARLVRQSNLWDEGVRVGKMLQGAQLEEDNGLGSQSGAYYGSKWGVYLRAPDLWFELLDRYGDRFAPLGELADVRFGVKSGKDCFFFVRDCSDEMLKECPNRKEFKARFGVARREVASGKVRLVWCGEEYGEIKPIEAKFLEPEVHSLMEVNKFRVKSSACARQIVLIGESKRQLAGTYVLSYIKWAEDKGYQRGPTCAARETRETKWYDLTKYLRPDVILPKIQQYRLIAFLNPERLYPNSSLLGLYNVPAELVIPICGILNSSLSILSRLTYARILGNEGNIQLDVYSAQMMLVPDLRRSAPDVTQRIARAMRNMCKRNVLYMLSERRLRQMSYIQQGRDYALDQLPDVCELDMKDRRELDDAVLEMMGVASPQERARLIDGLYGYLREFFEQVRQKEEKAIENKKRAKKRGRLQPAEIAAQIVQEIKENHPALLRSYPRDFIPPDTEHDVYDVPTEGRAAAFSDLLSANGVRFATGAKRSLVVEVQNKAQAELLCALAKSGVRGLVRVPKATSECATVKANYERFLSERGERLRVMAEDRTSDPDMQDKILQLIASMLSQG